LVTTLLIRQVTKTLTEYLEMSAVPANYLRYIKNSCAIKNCEWAH
jgi:hypothetical protein